MRPDFGSAAARIAERIFDDLRDTYVLCIGAGAEAVAGAFAARGPRLIEFCDALPDDLERYDIVLSGAGAPSPIIGADLLRGALKARKRRPVLLVDLASPGDVERDVQRLEDVFLYTAADLA